MLYNYILCSTIAKIANRSSDIAMFIDSSCLLAIFAVVEHREHQDSTMECAEISMCKHKVL